MKVIVFGATGSVGQHLVGQAVEANLQVTAFTRQPHSLQVKQPRLTTITGDVLNASAVADAIAEHDAVLVALGNGRKGTIRTMGTSNIIAAMHATGVRRLVCMSTLGAGESRPLLNFFWRRIMFGWLLREAYLDHQAQERLIRDSQLDWTIVRPGAFTDGPFTGVFQHGFPATTSSNLKLKISRPDVARFMLQQLNDETYLHSSPGLSY